MTRRVIKAYEIQPGMIVAHWSQHYGMASRTRMTILLREHDKPYIAFVFRTQSGFEAVSHGFGDNLFLHIGHADPPVDQQPPTVVRDLDCWNAYRHDHDGPTLIGRYPTQRQATAAWQRANRAAARKRQKGA